MGLEAAAAAVAGEEEDRVPAESGASLAAAATDVALAGSAGEGEAVGSKHSGRTLLLAIDLGLKMGASLFSSDGALIRYEYFALGSQDELLELAPRLLREWEAVRGFRRERARAAGRAAARGRREGAAPAGVGEEARGARARDGDGVF